MYERIGQVEGLAQAYANLGVLYTDRGEWAEAKDNLERSLEIAQRNDIPFFLLFALACLGDALRMEQRYQEALESYQRALDLIRARRVALMWKPHVVSMQALVYSALGEPGRAIALAQSALDESVENANRHAEDLAQLTLARVLLAAEDPALHARVESTIDGAEDRCEGTGMRVHLPSLVELRGTLAERRGNPQEARRRLREAHRLFVEMGAAGHAERLARELRR